MVQTQIYTRDPRPPLPPQVRAMSAMGLNWGVRGLLLTTRAKINAREIPSQSLSGVQRFTLVCLQAQIVVYAGTTHTQQTMVTLITGKTRRPPNSAPCRDQDGTGSGIFGVYQWAQSMNGLFQKLLTHPIKTTETFYLSFWAPLPPLPLEFIKICMHIQFQAPKFKNLYAKKCAFFC